MSKPQTPNQKKEAAYWAAELEKCKKLREPFERQWYLNMAFYNGKQYVQWTGTTGSALNTQALVEPKGPDWRVRLIANKVKPAIRTEFTKLSREDPHFYSKPATTEPDDVAAARAAELLIEFFLEFLKFPSIRRQATFWACITGTGFMKSFVVDRNGKNEVALEAPPTFQLYFPNLQEPDIEKQPYIMHVRTLSADQIYALFNVKVDPSMCASSPQSEQKFLHSIGIQQSLPKDQVQVKEIYIKPCKRYPNGGLLIYAGDTLVYPEVPETELSLEMLEKEWTETVYPFEHGRFPFDPIVHVPSGGFYGLSIIEDIIPLQKEYNRTRSQIVESKNKTAWPQLTYTKGSLDPKKVTAKPGLMIPIQPGMEHPRVLRGPDIPPYVIQELDRTLRDMDDLTGQYEITRGRTPPGVEAASAIAYLQEENDTKMYHTVASLEEAVASIGNKILALAKEYYTPAQLLEIVSTNSSYEVYQFTAATFNKPVDIRVESDSMAPKSRAARQAFITELMKMGLIPPEKGLRYLQMSETTRLYEELQVDSKAAQRENFKLSRGEPLPINPWDNHPVHKYEHGLFLKSQTFEQLDPEVQALFVQHYLAHEQFTVQQTMLGVTNGGIPDSNSSPDVGQPDPSSGNIF